MLSRWLEDTTPQHARRSREDLRRRSVPDRSESQQEGSSQQPQSEEATGTSSLSQEAGDEEERLRGGDTPADQSPIGATSCPSARLVMRISQDL